jgi:O-antigen/teichoic acid export membrane protein
LHKITVFGLTSPKKHFKDFIRPHIMQKKFLSNLILLLFLNLLVKPFWILGIDRGVQNAVGASEYGFYFAILNFSFIFNILLDFGITNFNNRNIAQHKQLLHKHFSSIVILKAMLSLVYFVVIFTAGLLMKYDARQLSMLALLGFNQFLLSFILYLRSNISGLLMFRTDSMLSVMDRLLMIIFCGILLWGNVSDQPFRIEWFVYTQTAAYLLTIAVAAGIVAVKARFRKLHWNYLFFIMILKKSFPFAVLVLLMAFYNRVDSVMIEKLLRDTIGNEQVGVYAQAYRLLDATNMIAYLFSVLLLPLFANMIRNKQAVQDLIKLSYSLLFMLAIIVAMSAVFYGEPLMRLLYPPHGLETTAAYELRISQSARVFSLLMCGFLPISTTYVFGSLLTANGNLKQLNLVAASGMVLNIILNLILVPRLFAVGSAITSLSTQSITAILQVLLVQWIFRFKPDYGFLMRLLVFTLGAVFLAWISSLSGLSWVKSLVAMIVCILVYSAVLKLMNIRLLIKILLGSEKA